jgi:hypothetical protein
MIAKRILMVFAVLVFLFPLFSAQAIVRKSSRAMQQQYQGQSNSDEPTTNQTTSNGQSTTNGQTKVQQPVKKPAAVKKAPGYKVEVKEVKKVRSADGTAMSEEGGSILSFQLSGIGFFQSGGASVTSGMFSWNPTINASDWLDLRMNFGITILKADTEMNFFAAEYSAALALKTFDPVIIQLGGGAQSWFNNGGTKPIVTFDLAYRLAHPWLDFIDRFYLGYASILSSPSKTNIIRGGLGVSF